VVEAGVVLQTLHDAAAAQGLLFPIDLGARGTATIGGLVSTNAGGERVLRFGMMRDQVLGLEVVTADGTILDLMAEVLKNNAGYDLKQLFIGSEGTLGIVTRIALRLRPALARAHTAFAALSSLEYVPAVLAHCENSLSGTLSAFELMWPEFVETMCGGADAPHRAPVELNAACYLLLESEGNDEEADARRFIAALERLMEDGAVVDVAIAQSDSERSAFWAIRAEVGRIIKLWDPAISFDVSVPIAQMLGFVDELRRELIGRWPQARMMTFGHVADNNLHLVISAGPDTKANAKTIAAIVYHGVGARHGSISAEHGIGLDKRDALASQVAEPVLRLMRQLKQTMDPGGLFNPGKVV
jgi:FAD/FMN-containing dehydrogenase